MQIIKLSEKIANKFFYVGIMIQTIVMIIGFSEYDIPFRGRFLQLSFAFFCIKILTTRYEWKEWITMIVLGFLGAVSYYFGAEEYVVSVVVMIFAAKAVDMRKVLKYIFAVALASSIVTAVLSLAGIGGVSVDIRDYGRGGVEARWCLGFGHANNLHGTLWYLISLLCICYNEKLNWKHYLVLTVINLFLFSFTVSKAGVLATQIVIIAATLLQYYKKIGQSIWIYLCGVAGIILFIAISFLSVSLNWEEHTWMKLLDRILTGRINLAYRYAPIKTWNLFSPGGKLIAVDNGWVATFFNYGYVVGIILILLHVYLVYRAYEKKNGIWLVLIITCVFYTFMEATYTINDAYLLSNLTYIVAMVCISEGRKLTLKPE